MVAVGAPTGAGRGAECCTEDSAAGPTSTCARQPPRDALEYRTRSARRRRLMSNTWRTSTAAGSAHARPRRLSVAARVPGTTSSNLRRNASQSVVMLRVTWCPTTANSRAYTPASADTPPTSTAGRMRIPASRRRRGPYRSCTSAPAGGGGALTVSCRRRRLRVSRAALRRHSPQNSREWSNILAHVLTQSFGRDLSQRRATTSTVSPAADFWAKVGSSPGDVVAVQVQRQ